MEETSIPNDSPIEYFKSNIRDENDSSFDFILLGSPKFSKLSFTIIISILLGAYFIVSLFVSNILLTPMTVEGASMYPTLNAEYTTTGNVHAQDVVYLKPTQNVKFQDIIVFNSNPYTNNVSPTPTYYIKRVIAIAGDTIRFEKTNQSNAHYSVYSINRNGETLIEDYINEPIKYSTSESINELILSEQTITIPTGYVFVLGDNRNHSKDSRELGLISTEDIFGKLVIHIPYGQTIIHGLIRSIKNDYIL